MRPCNESIRKTLGLVETMLVLADEGDEVREDSGCGVLFGVLRDSAFKLKRLAEAERDAHIKKGWWNSEESYGLPPTWQRSKRLKGDQSDDGSV